MNMRWVPLVAVLILVTTAASGAASELTIKPGAIERIVLTEPTGATFEQPATRDTAMYPRAAFSVARPPLGPLVRAFSEGYSAVFESSTSTLLLTTGSNAGAIPLGGGHDAVASAAISDDGTVALAVGTTIRLFTRTLRERRAPTCPQCGSITKVIYDQDEIFVYVESDAKILAARADDEEFVEVASLEHLPFRPADVAVHRGILYACGGTFIAVGSRKSQVFTSTPFQNVNNLTKIAVTARRLYLLDGQNRVFVRPRLAPLSLRFNGAPTTYTEGLIRLYDHLSKRSLLPVRHVKTERPYESVTALLQDAGVIIDEPKPGSSARNRLESLLRTLNVDGPFLGPLQQPVPKDIVVRLPYFHARRLPGIASVEVTGQSFEQILAAFLPAKEREQVNRQDLAYFNGVVDLTMLDAFIAKRGFALIPVAQLRVTILASVADIADSTSDLHVLLVDSNITPLPVEEGVLSSSSCDSGGTDGANLAAAKANRARLREIVGHLSPAVPPRPITIAIAEEAHSIDFTHPDFFTNTESIWRRSGPRGLAVDSSKADATSPYVRSFRKRDDHGTHVAGVLAARGTTTPGLVEGSRLFLIDVTNPAADPLDAAINDALGHGIKLFNFSNTIKKADATWDVLRGTIKVAGATSLFVVAAGNDGAVLEDPASVDVPLRWAALPNVLGVGAANECSDLLGDFNDGDSVAAGSNYGSKFVHLLAPGTNIFSCAKGAAYAVASGTSDAAPLVTAAAAALYQVGKAEPSLIKARLIYTADWKSQYLRKIAGGRLNIRRALTDVDANVLWTESEPHGPYALVFDAAAPELVVWKKGKAKRVHGADALPEELPFRDVLRLHRQSNKLYRIVYMEYPKRGEEAAEQVRPRVRVLYDVELDPVSYVPCASLRAVDATPAIVSGGDMTKLCASSVSLVQITDYIAALPSTPVFFE